jgi:PAS domain S-box-containing protein
MQQTQRPATLEFRIVRNDGQMRYLSSRCEYFTTRKGQRYFIGTTQDVTDLKSAEAKLKENTALLQRIFDSSLTGISVFKSIRDDNGNIVDFECVAINKKSIEYSRRNDFVGKRYAETYPGLKESGVFDKYAQVVETGIPAEFELPYPYDGYDHWFRLVVVKLNDGMVVSSEDITTRKRSEIRLQEQAHFIESITNTIPDVVGVVEHATGLIEYVNRDAMELLGFDADEIMSMPVEERRKAIHPDDREKLVRYYQRFNSLSESDQNKIEYRVFNKHGMVLWLSMRGRVFRKNAEGVPTHSLNICRDITDIRNAEQFIVEEHNRLKEAQAMGHVGNFEWSAATDRMIWSDEMYRIHGLEPQSEDITLDRILNFVHPDDRHWVNERILHARKKATKGNFSHRILKDDDTIRYIHRHYESFANAKGEVVRVTGTVLDITDIKRAEEELQKNFQILKQTEEVAGMGSWEYTPQSKTFNWSDGMYTLFELPSATGVKPETYLDFVIPEDRMLAEKIVRCIGTDHRAFEETIRIKPNDKVKTLKVKGNVIRDENGNPIKVLGVDFDISAISDSHKHIEQQANVVSRVIEATPDIVQIVHVDSGRSVYLNRMLLEELGYSFQEIKKREIEKSTIELFHPDDRPIIEDFQLRLASATDDIMLEAEARIKNSAGAVAMNGAAMFTVVSCTSFGVKPGSCSSSRRSYSWSAHAGLSRRRAMRQLVSLHRRCSSLRRLL